MLNEGARISRLQEPGKEGMPPGRIDESPGLGHQCGALPGLQAASTGLWTGPRESTGAKLDLIAAPVGGVSEDPAVPLRRSPNQPLPLLSFSWA